MAYIHFWSSFVFLYIVSLSLLLPIRSAKSSNETDRQALLEIKTKIIDDPLGVLSSWNNSIHFCQWSGVTCGRMHQRVTVLDLGSRTLGGSISPSIGNLSFLRELDLTNNSFRDAIPPEISHLQRLQILALNNNSLAGGIPSNVSRCSNLRSLSIYNNKLTGEIPAEIGFLSKLEFLSLWANNITGGIPASLGNLSSLHTLSAGRNPLAGEIPPTLGQLRKLTFFELNSNQLSGLVPPQIFNLSSITYMQMANNRLQGYVPKDLFISLANVQVFSIAANQFKGSIPPSLSNATNLSYLQLQINQLTGKMPDLRRLNRLRRMTIQLNYLGRGDLDDLNFLCSLTNASTLDFLDISYNNFGGALPECIGNLSSQLNVLSIENNQISGSIPIGIGNLINLESIQAWGNNLSGIIPKTIGFLKNLLQLYLVGNKLSGEVPSSLGNLTMLINLDIYNNRLQGTIPSSLGECRSLLSLNLSKNKLNGSLPLQVIGFLSQSVSLDFSQNQFIGSIPLEIGKLVTLALIDVSNNMLSNEIPGELGSCTSLERLYMQGNLFRGAIPSSLKSLRALQALDLSRNNLSGPIPEFLTTLRLLLYLNLSFNGFEGIVPTEGVFKNASAVSLMGNKMLCGGIPEFQLAACNSQKGNRRKQRIIIATISGILGVSLVFFLIFLLRSKKEKEKHNSSSSGNSMLKVSYRDLHEATNGFSPENLIGAGSYGSVFQGTLKEGGLLIAVKVIKLQHRGANKSFVAECEALRNTRHRNLVKVLTACSSIDYQGNDFKALVYEYMNNGSLEEWLHPPLQYDATSQAQKHLTLEQRLNIAIDVANALEYLHGQCETTLVHCDLKPSNVLLDGELIGHVSDFGLAKFLSKGIQDDPTNQSSSVGLRGTVGYAPPEYGLGSEVSTSGDVYSFGIMLLEMFTGKRPTDEMFQSGQTLHKLAEKSLSDGVAEIIDPMLLEDIGEIGTSTVIDRKSSRNTAEECLTSIVHVGVACSAELPGERMSISDVSARLCSIRSKLLH